ncbi:MAG: lipopolysaccharide transport periplasmic protein LptA, partial [Rhodovulum sp.]|nr:lipopolysaccharide transport periplasmic protein LptA [Rhodovulum sp.]
LVNGGEAAEAARAEYTIDSASIILSGNVLLTQGQNALSGERLIVDLNTGQGTMQGRVKTIFQPGAAQ